MTLLLTKLDQKKLRVCWLAWRCINSRTFEKAFKPILDFTINEIITIYRKCNYTENILEVGKIGLTINPSYDFAFSLIPEVYYINIWDFLFCLQPNEMEVFFRPPFLLANELVHEYSHYKFYKKKGILGKSTKIKKQFRSLHGAENDLYALNEELIFLKKLRKIVPNEVNIKFFRINKWDINGIPSFETKFEQMPTRENIDQYITAIINKINTFTSIEEYDKSMVKIKSEKHSIMSSVLKLDLDLETKVWPVKKMKI